MCVTNLFIVRNTFVRIFMFILVENLEFEGICNITFLQQCVV